MDAKTLSDQDAKHWELYHVEKDFAENHNLAESNRDKLIEMICLWYVEAGKYNVLPIDSRGQLRLGEPRPQLAVDRKSYQYYQGTQTVPTNAAVNTLNRPYSITVDAEIPASGAEGVLLSHGGNDGGFSFYLQGGKLHYAYNYVAETQYHLESKESVPAGRHKLRYEFEPTGNANVGKGLGAPGRGQLYIDGKLVGQIDLAKTIPLCVGLGGGVTAGADPGSPVTELYKPPYTFTGIIHTAVIDVSGGLIKDDEATMRMALARQ
jgi:arylsulfatase